MIEICIQCNFLLSTWNAHFHEISIFHCIYCPHIIAWTKTTNTNKEMEPKASYIVRSILSFVLFIDELSGVFSFCSKLQMIKANIISSIFIIFYIKCNQHDSIVIIIILCIVCIVQIKMRILNYKLNLHGKEKLTINWNEDKR